MRPNPTNDDEQDSDESKPAPAPVASRAHKKLLGLVSKKERWGLSWRGWLAAGVLALLTAYWLLQTIQPFLAVTQRVDAKYLVMEGWVHEFAAKGAAEEFTVGNYQQVFVTGVPVAGSGLYDSDSNTEAYVGAGLLKRAGVPEAFLQRVPRRRMDRDRTYGSALALKAWFYEHGLKVQRINVVTESAHARRTRLMFEAALGPDVTVGIIAVRNPDYDPDHWWHYSEGVREVLGESLAYLYARLLFRPETGPQP